MGLLNAILGTASQTDPKRLRGELEPMLIEGEEIVAAYKVFRDLYVFTQSRLILVDKQGLTGKKVLCHSIPYRSITQFSVETAGHFDLDAELRIYISGNPHPVKREFRNGTNIHEIQRMLAAFVLTR